MAVQLSFFELPASKVVNVAQVKHRSPFRYPGGKTWLIPRIFQWAVGKKLTEFIEPFAGGAIVGLTVAFEQLANHVTLVELDEKVAAVWQTIIEHGEGEWLAQRIIDFDFDIDNINDMLRRENLPTKELAFQTILQNRIAHGGILAKGAGMLKNGENGRGVGSRWYPQTLAKRIKDIDRIRDRITFLHEDAFGVIERYKDYENVAFFIDPPYTAGSGKRAGARLYRYFEIDHERLFSLLETVKGDFLLTYDNDEFVRKLADRHRFEYVTVAMQNTHLAKMKELLIGRNLSWLHQKDKN